MLLPTVILLLVASPIAVYAFPEFALKGLVVQGSHSTGQHPLEMNTHGAVPYDPRFPYTGAKLDGKAGTGKGGVRVPDPGDKGHQFQDPPPGAQRGPCPGLNTLANHGFISRDGITSYTEIVAALQNAYNLEYNLAVALTVLGMVFGGDPVTEKLSIGGSVPLETGEPGRFTGPYGGVSEHNTFELDVSLTRNDYYLHGDAASFNGTLFGMMVETAKAVNHGVPLFNFDTMAQYRWEQYKRSRADNPWMNFPELGLHNYGASTFPFTVFTSSATNSTPDLTSISSFFGAVLQPNGTWTHVPERFPDKYYNPIIAPSVSDAAMGINKLYEAHPVEFGANVNGVWINSTTDEDAPYYDVVCGAYDEIVSHAKSSYHPFAMLDFVVKRANPIFGPDNCTLFTFP